MIRVAVVLAAAIMLGYVVVPLAGLFFRISPQQLFAAVTTRGATGAMQLSLETTALALACTVLFGTPLALLVARGDFPGRRLVDAAIDLPIVVPPAVAGLGLLVVFGRQGLLGAPLHGLGITLSFTTAAVVMAQVFVASPFYVRSARNGFLAVDRTLEEASATLGMSPVRTFLRITVPLAAPALLGGAVLTWARALGEFGATIMFAGNLPGISQTLPLAVYLGLESGDLDVAIALSAALVLVSLGIVAAVRVLER